jgi:hypothetical protein
VIWPTITISGGCDGFGPMGEHREAEAPTHWGSEECFSPSTTRFRACAECCWVSEECSAQAQQDPEPAKTVVEVAKEESEATKSAVGDCQVFISSELDQMKHEFRCKKYELTKVKSISNALSGSEPIIEERGINQLM